MADEAEDKPKLRPAEENVWYLLATLHGQPGDEGYSDETHRLNREKWNACMSRYPGVYAFEVPDERNESLRLSTYFLPETIERELLAPLEKRAGRRVELPPREEKIDFNSTLFERYINFNGFRFPDRTTFVSSVFRYDARFENARFLGTVNFFGVAFEANVFFRSATFDSVHFRRAIFNGRTHFEKAKFLFSPNFIRAVFSYSVSFDGTTFSNGVLFKESIFSFDARFRRSIFSDGASFERATFKAHAYFQNAKFEMNASFQDVEFTTFAPSFHEAKLHQGTDWRVKHPWPLPTSPDKAASFVAAYERLKLEMDAQKRHEDELNFFALEMRSRRVLFGGLQGRAIDFYGWVCDYGRDWLKPLECLFWTVYAGWLAFWWGLGPAGIWQAAGLSFANTFAVLGFRKELIDPDVLKSLPGYLGFLSGAQTAVGIVLLFLAGLALRNRPAFVRPPPPLRGTSP
jgi:uncharacterized protein YjbI with pentapeptide repeats